MTLGLALVAPGLFLAQSRAPSSDQKKQLQRWLDKLLELRAPGQNLGSVDYLLGCCPPNQPLKPLSRCEPSQIGFFLEPPQRQST